jgi:hypothetical protein
VPHLDNTCVALTRFPGKIMLKEIDLTIQSDTQLDNIIDNTQRAGELAFARRAVIEKANRGKASRRQLGLLEWNQERVTSVIAPFVELSKSVVNSARTSFSRAGGGKFQLRIDPNYLWIDSYTGVKTSALNATMSCHIARPGDQPIFTLTVKPGEIRSYSFDELDVALSEWREVITRAKMDSP